MCPWPRPGAIPPPPTGGAIAQARARFARFQHLEPDILDESITAADLMFMLEHLHFGRNARSTRQSALLLPAVQWLMG